MYTAEHTRCALCGLASLKVAAGLLQRSVLRHLHLLLLVEYAALLCLALQPLDLLHPFAHAGKQLLRSSLGLRV